MTYNDPRREETKATRAALKRAGSSADELEAHAEALRTRTDIVNLEDEAPPCQCCNRPLFTPAERAQLERVRAEEAN